MTVLNDGTYFLGTVWKRRRCIWRQSHIQRRRMLSLTRCRTHGFCSWSALFHRRRWWRCPTRIPWMSLSMRPRTISMEYSSALHLYKNLKIKTRLQRKYGFHDIFACPVKIFWTNRYPRSWQVKCSPHAQLILALAPCLLLDRFVFAAVRPFKHCHRHQQWVASSSPSLKVTTCYNTIFKANADRSVFYLLKS